MDDRMPATTGYGSTYQGPKHKGEGVPVHVVYTMSSRVPIPTTVVFGDNPGLQQNPVPRIEQMRAETPRVLSICGTVIPNGTRLRADHKGVLYAGFVENGAIVVNGKRFTRPSPAAQEITRTSVNGWMFWSCCLPGESKWQLLSSLRTRPRRAG